MKGKEFGRARLLSVISQVHLVRERGDWVFWSFEAVGSLLTHSFHEKFCSLMLDSNVPSINFVASRVWGSLAPPKVELFV